MKTEAQSIDEGGTSIIVGTATDDRRDSSSGHENVSNSEQLVILDDNTDTDAALLATEYIVDGQHYTASKIFLKSILRK